MLLRASKALRSATDRTNAKEVPDVCICPGPEPERFLACDQNIADTSAEEASCRTATFQRTSVDRGSPGLGVPV